MHDHTPRDQNAERHHDGANGRPAGGRPAEVVAEGLQGTAVHSHHGTAQDEHAEHSQHLDHGGGQPADHGQHEQHGPGGAHAGHGEAMFARPFWIALVLTVPILIYAEPIEHLLGYTAPQFPGSGWLVPVLASVIYWYCGRVFLTGAISELRSRQPGMMTLVALAISTAYFYSLAITFGLVQGMPFYWEQATLVTVMLLGHWMEMRAVGSAQSALQELAKLLPDTAERPAPGQAGHAGPERRIDRGGAESGRREHDDRRVSPGR